MIMHFILALQKIPRTLCRPLLLRGAITKYQGLVLTSPFAKGGLRGILERYPRY
jgi:hypothetical protein